MFHGTVLKVSLVSPSSGEVVPAYVYKVDFQYLHVLMARGRELVTGNLYISTRSLNCGEWFISPEGLAAVQDYVKVHFIHKSVRGYYYWNCGYLAWCCTVGREYFPSWAFHAPDVGLFLSLCGFDILELS